MTQQATTTDYRINAIYRQANDSEKRNKRYQEEDPLQYYRITDKNAYIKKLKNQVRTGKATGNCKRDHLLAYSKLLMGMMDNNNGLEDIKFLYFEYNNPNAGDYHKGHHYTILVKINNIWYVRDDTNYIQEQRNLYEYFNDRDSMNLLKFKEKIILVTKNEGKNFQIDFDEYRERDFPIMTYCYHNIIVKNLRGEGKYVKN